MAIIASRNSKATEDMEAMIQEFSVQDWAEHEQFVQMFRAAKQRKRVCVSRQQAAVAHLPR